VVDHRPPAKGGLAINLLHPNAGAFVLRGFSMSEWAGGIRRNIFNSILRRIVEFGLPTPRATPTLRSSSFAIHRSRVKVGEALRDFCRQAAERASVAPKTGLREAFFG
jgi:hypothetical protein